MEIDEIIVANKYFKESRLPSLYSDFERLRLLNPEGFNANIEAWGSLLIDIIKHYKENDSRVSLPTVNPDLQQLLSNATQGRPRGMKVVLNELVARRTLVPYSHYISVTIPYSEIVDNSLSIYNRIRLYFNGVTSSANDRYLSWDLTCLLGNKCYGYIEGRGYTGKLYNEETLYTFLKTKVPDLSYIDFIIVLKYLNRDINKCLVSIVDETTYIKFDSMPLTKEDIDIINLIASINKLTERKVDLEAKITDIKTQISNSSEGATLKHLLKLKHLVNQSMDRTLSALSQLNTVLIKIDDSNMNLAVYHQILSSTKILKTLNGKIDIDEIEEINLDLKQEIDRVDEATEALIGDVNDSEIDEEYERLVKEEKRKKEGEKGEKGEDKKAKEGEEEKAKEEEQEHEQKQGKEQEKEQDSIHNSSSTDLLNRLNDLNIDKEVNNDPILEPAQ